jgi:hypothetical protein
MSKLPGLNRTYAIACWSSSSLFASESTMILVFFPSGPAGPAAVTGWTQMSHAQIVSSARAAVFKDRSPVELI